MEGLTLSIWLIIGFIIGIIVIVKGGDFFLDAATWIAEISGIPKFVIGATVVSLATTLRSEEHTTELQSRDYISYAVFCL